MKNKKIISLIMIAVFAMSYLNVGAVNSPNFVNKEVAFTDVLDNFDKTWEYDGPLQIKIDEAITEDKGVSYRTYAAPAYVIYKSEKPITGFYIRYTAQKNSGVSVLLSNDGENWTVISQKLIGTEPWQVGWTWHYIMQNENIPASEDYRFMKVMYVGEGSGYSPRVSHVEYYCDGITSSEELVTAKVPTPLDLSPYRRQALLFIRDGSMTEENLDKEVTRGEFADIIAKASRLGGIGGDGSFSDVFSSTSYYESIASLKAAGLMNGFADGSFRPDAFVTYEQAAMVLLKMLGYGITITNDNSVVGRAVTLGIFKGIDQSKPLTKDVIAGMLWNASMCEMLAVNSISRGNGEVITKTNSTFLESVMGIVEFEGLITATKMGRIAGERPEAGNIAIDLNEIEVYDEDIHYCLGYRVKYYRYDNSDNKKIISYIVDERTKPLTVEGRDIESVTNKKIVYTDEEGERKDKSINLKFVLENGMRNYSGSYLTVQAMQKKDGFVTFTDTDFDNYYDTAIITDFEIFAVGDINTAAKTIIDEFTAEKIVLDTEEDKNLVIISKGMFSDFPIIKEKNVLSVARSSEYTICYVTSGKTSGSISEFDDDKLTIGKKQYKLSFNFLNKAKEGIEGYGDVALGYSATFYLDHMGNIAYAIFDISGSKYAFLADAGIKGNLGGTLELKLYDGNEVKIYDVGDSLAIYDGVSTKKYTAKEAYAKLLGDKETPEQLVLVKYGKENNIEKIQIAKDGKDAMEFSLDYTSNVTEIASYNIIDLKYAIGKDKTNVFVVPYDRADDGYTTSISLVSREEYKVYMYDIDELNIPEAVVVFTGKNYGSKTDLNYTNVAVVNKLYYKYNSEKGETEPILDVITNNTAKGYTVSSKFTGVQNSDSFTIDSLKQGDVIRIGRDAFGDVIKVELIYSVEDDIHKGTTTIASQNYTAVGTLKKSDGVYFLVAIDGDSEAERLLYGSSLKVAIVDKKNKAVTIGSATDLHDGDRIVMYNYKATIKDIIVIRE